MGVKLRELYEGSKKFDLKLLAGSSGLDNVARWVHMVENINLSVFLESHEVAFTTGVAINSKEELLELVIHTHKNNASGMVINIGPHIESIPSNVLEYCDNNDFPLFEIPWNVYISEIMREFSYKITLSDITNMELSNALKNAIFFHDQEPLYVPHLERYSFKSHWSYCLAVIEVINKDTRARVGSKRRSKILKSIEIHATNIKKRTFAFELDKRFVIVFADYDIEEIKIAVEQIKETSKKILSKKEEIYLSVGYCAKNIKCIGKSYQKALSVLNIQKKKKAHNKVELYKNLGLYKLLLSMEDHEIIDEFHEENLEPLIKFDTLNDTDYVSVLRCYLDFNGSVKDVAAHLFYHRNTINYKLKKIEEILQCNLSQLDTRLKLIVDFMLLDIK